MRSVDAHYTAAVGMRQAHICELLVVRHGHRMNSVSDMAKRAEAR